MVWLRTMSVIASIFGSVSLASIAFFLLEERERWGTPESVGLALMLLAMSLGVMFTTVDYILQ